MFTPWSRKATVEKCQFCGNPYEEGFEHERCHPCTNCGAPDTHPSWDHPFCLICYITLVPPGMGEARTVEFLKARGVYRGEMEPA